MRVVFFFQAEDGIRDLIVTGVQTCALLISSRRRHTRSDRDWSSDVCSSDLILQAIHRLEKSIENVRFTEPREIKMIDAVEYFIFILRKIHLDARLHIKG